MPTGERVLKTIWKETIEVLWLISMVAGLSLLGIAIAVAALAVTSQPPPTNVNRSKN